LTPPNWCGSFSPIEAALTQLANMASKEVATKSGGKMACQGGGGKVECSFL